MDALHLSLVSAAIAAVAALGALRVRAAPTMRDQGWLAVVAATGAAELLFNVITYGPASTDLMVIWATRAQVALICAHVAAWSAYSCAFMGLPLRRDAIIIPALLAAALLALVPGAVLTGQVSVRVFSDLDTVYRDVKPAAFAWLVFAMIFLQAARVALRFVHAWRTGIPWAGAHAFAIGIAAALGANDGLVISGVYSGPYLVDLGFAVPGAILLVATGGRLVDIARALAALRESLEAQVSARSAELVASERKVRDAQQLALLGQMAAGVAHELTNPIGAALSRLRTVSDGLSQHYPGSGLAGDLSEATVALLRVQGLAARVRNASLLVSTGGSPAPVGLAATLRAALELAEPELASADVTLDVEPGATALAQEAVTIQVVRDLLVNVASARASRGRAHLTVRARTDGTRVRIEVEEDGIGKDAGVPAQATEPYSGSRTPAPRSGAGLAFARSLVRGLGGELDLRSEPGRGTVATLELPAARRLPD